MGAVHSRSDSRFILDQFRWRTQRAAGRPISYGRCRHPVGVWFPWRRAGGRLALQCRRSESCVCLRTAASNSPSACRRGSEVGSKQQLTAHVVQVWLAHARGNKIDSAAIKGLAAIRSFQSASFLHGQQFVRPRERRRPQRIKCIR